jgi:ATP-dependent DNA helicase RecG
LREAVLNAIVHRDYAVPAPIQIRVYEHKLKIWNPAVLPDNWDLEKLLGAHASHPYNPDVANAFFRSGEIESWGRGIERIFDACRTADSPLPRIQLDGHDLWVEFPYPDEYLAILRGKEEEIRPAENKMNAFGLVEGLVESQRKILKIVKENPRISKKAMAEAIGISTTAIDKNIEKLKTKGLLRHIGPAKGGHWEVLK